MLKKAHMAACVLTLILWPGSALANLDCGKLDGQWSGSMRGLLNGATTMSIKNCSLAWKLPDGRTNRCRFKERAGKVEYSCSLGSRGVVAINGNKITMQNVYTAARGRYTVNFTRAGQ